MKANTKYATESTALEQTMTSSKKAALVEKWDIIATDENDELIDYQSFQQNALLNYVINLSQNIFTQKLIDKKFLDNKGIEHSVYQQPQGENLYHIFTLPFEKFFSLMTGGDKGQYEYLKKMINRYYGTDKKGSTTGKAKVLTDPYDLNHHQIATPFELTIDFTTFSLSTDSPEIKKWNKAINSEMKKKGEEKAISYNFFKNFKRTEFNFIQVRLHDWIVQGMQLKNQKNEAEKKISFQTIPQNLFPNVVSYLRYMETDATKPIMLAGAYSSLFRFINTKDTHYSFSEENKIKTETITLSLKEYLYHLEAEMMGSYGKNINSFKMGKAETKTRLEYELFFFSGMMFDFLMQGKMTGSKFILKESCIDIEKDEIKLTVYRPTKKLIYNEATLEDIKKQIKDIKKKID